MVDFPNFNILIEETEILGMGQTCVLLMCNFGFT